MKKHITAIALLSAISFGAVALAPSDAKALMLVNAIEGQLGQTWAPDDPNAQGAERTEEVGGEVALCIILAPLCLLDKKGSNGASSVSTKDLAENGYSPKDIQQIQNDQNMLINRLVAHNMSIKISGNDTKVSIAKDIRSVYPDASDTYVDFVTSANALK